jgi:hypothetical protein
MILLITFVLSIPLISFFFVLADEAKRESEYQQFTDYWNRLTSTRHRPVMYQEDGKPLMYLD